MDQPDPALIRRRLRAEATTAVAGAGLILVGIAWASRFVPAGLELPLILPTSPVMLGVALQRRWLALIVAGIAHTLAVTYYLDAIPIVAIPTALGLMASAVLGATISRRTNVSLHFEDGRQVIAFLLIGLGVSAFGSALSGAIGTTGLQTGLEKAVLLCWIADGMGMLLIGPAWLLALQRPKGWPLRGIDSLMLLVVTAVTYGIYAGHLDPEFARPLSYAVFPLIMATSYRCGRLTTALAIAGIAAIAISCTALGKGPFAINGLQADVLALHANLAILSLTGLIMAVIRYQKSLADAAMQTHLLRFARANRLDAMSTLAAGMAHELNQPLTSANAYAQSIRRQLKNDTHSADLQPALDGMITSNERAARIVRHFRHYLGDGENHAERFDIRRGVSAAIDLVRPTLNDHRIALDVDLPDRPVEWIGDPVGLEQIVVNLLQNADEALMTRPSDEPRWIHVLVRCQPRRRRLRLLVRDNGPGLDEARLEHLFEPLASGHDSGTGLGLAISRSIAEAHGGWISGRNRVGGGAEFTLELSMAEP
ncbi:ATP-binding protein [Spiribacter vilamensis]|uniref:histidine kinase n=1 Tax=Spiribacter vilamensis TaxID=531306 RepID=A0A4Q8CZC6_9GAMM|nr:ATP-binding protein [Spiribacter vilamensis]RZU98381.1 two-component system NtrC family sensor kinase [Spiribacter vilamensis]TVO60737.1 hypothetical protein FPL09_00790 [Spiribacter vilamensis]